MKKTLFTLIVLTFFVNLFSLKTYGYTDNSKNIELIGDANGLVFIPTDNFLTFQNILPGDQVQGKIIIKNNYNAPYEVLLKQERTFIDPDSTYDLLSKLDLKIKYDGNIIYDGSADGNQGLNEEINLGTFYPGEEKVLTATITLDGKTTGNEYKNKYASSKWIFTAINLGKNTINGSDSKINTLPQTGSEKIYIDILFALILIGGGIYTYLYKRNNK